MLTIEEGCPQLLEGLNLCGLSPSLGVGLQFHLRLLRRR